MDGINGHTGMQLTLPKICSRYCPTYVPRCKLTAAHRPRPKTSAWQSHTCQTRARRLFSSPNSTFRSQRPSHTLQYHNLALLLRLRPTFQPYYNLY